MQRLQLRLRAWMPCGCSEVTVKGERSGIDRRRRGAERGGGRDPGRSGQAGGGRVRWGCRCEIRRRGVVQHQRVDSEMSASTRTAAVTAARGASETHPDAAQPSRPRSDGLGPSRSLPLDTADGSSSESCCCTELRPIRLRCACPSPFSAALSSSPLSCCCPSRCASLCALACA